MGVEEITIVRKERREPCKARLYDELSADQLIEIHEAWKPVRDEAVARIKLG